jgi:hypothetical protein
VADPHELIVEAEIGEEDDGPGHGSPRNSRERTRPGYFPCCRRCQRVFFRSFLCFFFRIFLRRFLTTEGKRSFLSPSHVMLPPEPARGYRV